MKGPVSRPKKERARSFDRARGPRQGGGGGCRRAAPDAGFAQAALRARAAVVVFAAAAMLASATSTACLVALLTWSNAVFAADTACLTSVTMPSVPAGAFLAIASI